MLQIGKKRDGTFEVMAPGRSNEEDLCELEALIKSAKAMGALIRVCRMYDRNEVLRPVKAILAVDPSEIQIS